MKYLNSDLSSSIPHFLYIPKSVKITRRSCMQHSLVYGEAACTERTASVSVLGIRR